MRVSIYVLWVLCVVFDPSARAFAENVDFNRDIRPILSNTCFTCHGPDDATRKAGLRLDQRDSAIKPAKSKAIAIVPGDPSKSELIRRLTTRDEDDAMPPEKTGKKLTAAQIDTLKKWIAQGAPYAGHWAFIPPQRPDIPVVKNTAWPKTDIDRFILVRLEAEGLSPSTPADRATLIRRAALDLTGLPPTPGEVDAFINDSSANAWEKVIDRLLASPRYGERMAMDWLDGARYADSHGYQADWERYQWRWRDWVIEAYNANKPFDQFTIEQLAGDLLPSATIEQKVATGFNRNHRMNTEGGTIPEEWRTEYVIDRVDTMGTVWLGLTLGCARCHDHKYDPISQKEFYQLYSFFNNNAESGKGAEKAGNHEPAIKAPRAADTQRLAELDTAIASAEKVVRERESRLPELLAAWEKSPEARKPGVGWTTLEPVDLKSATNTSAFTKQPDQSVLVKKRQASTDTGVDTYTIILKSNLKSITAIRVETLPDDSLPAKGPGRGSNGNFVLTDATLTIDAKPAKLASASADFSQQKYPVKNAIDTDKSTGWAIHPQTGAAHAAVFALAGPAKSDKAQTLVLKLDFRSQYERHSIGRFRVSVTDSAAPHDAAGTPAAILAILDTPVEKRTDKQKSQLLTYFRERSAGDVTAADAALAKAKSDRAAYEESIPSVMVMQELDKPRDAFILVRGQYDRPGEKVSAALPQFFGAMPAGAPVNRLGLAQWIVQPDNPLTARVAVNRFWERFFGVGIVKTSENFGSQAEWPSHPELLDYLATEFVRLGWDMKAMQKQIMMSAAYQQSAKVSPELLARDPENRLLARGPRFRLQAEIIRDQAMFVSGLLVEKLGGPSVRPYQPDGIWDEINVYGNLRNYKADTGEGLRRRSLYTIWKRTASPPSMTLFDMPNREICTVKRSRTNTPLQALALMNDVTYVEASRVLAEKMLKHGDTPQSRITYAFARATGRAPTSQELNILTSGLAKRLAKYKSDSTAARNLVAQGSSKPHASFDPAELAAYTLTASVILNLDEVITRE